MADVNLVKSKYTDSDVTSLGELAAADNAKIPGTLQVVGATTLDTDLTVANGGTGASTLTDHGVLLGSGTDPVTAMTALAAGEIIVGVGSADPHALAAGATTKILVGGGAADPVWTEATGTGAPVRATSPTLITPALGTPASGTLTNCTGYPSASTTVTGIVELDTVTETITGTDTSRATTAQGVAAAAAILKNPLAYAQGVAMTAAASGSSGITVANNGNINFGTGNFTLVWKGSLPDWTPGATTILAKKRTTGGFNFYIDASNKFVAYINAGVVTSTSANTFTDGTAHEIVFVIDRTNGTYIYVDGSLFHTGSALTADVSETAALYIAGDGTSRAAGTVHHAYTFNRALTAAEVLSLYRNGIDFADKWGSQTSLITGDDSTFAGASNWANVDINSYDETTGGVLTITANAAGQYCTLPIANATTVIGKKYRLTYTVSSIAATWTITDFTGTGQTIGTVSADGTTSIEFTAATTGGLRLVSVANNSSGVFDNVLLYEIGATLALESEGIQRDGWKDSSTNGLNASYPASGYSFLRPIRTDSAEGLLSVTNVSFAADADTTIYTVPVGKRLVLTKAILVAGADAGASVISIGADGTETDWIPNNTLSALDAANDAAILMPVPNTTPTLIKSYAGGTVIQAKVSSHAGGATNSLSLFGYLY